MKNILHQQIAVQLSPEPLYEQNWTDLVENQHKLLKLKSRQLPIEITQE